MTIYLNDVGIVCAVGNNHASVRRSIFSNERSGVTVREGFADVPLPVGLVDQQLEQMASYPIEMRSRNNALLLVALRQIEAQVNRVIDRYGADRVGVVIGTSTSGIGEGENAAFKKTKTQRVPGGYDYRQQEMGNAAAFVSHEIECCGPSWVVSTACSSSARALASAARLIQSGMVDAVIAGGADSLCRFTIAGFRALESVSVDVCNPFSRNRRGINIGEGAALFVVSKDEASVCLSGFGESSDAHHMSSPDPTGQGAVNAMRRALAKARLAPSDIEYLNLHGTATAQNDAMESRAVGEVFERLPYSSSTKPLTGHTLGAAGAIEAALCWLTLQENENGLLPLHWWDAELDPALTPLQFVDRKSSLGRAPKHIMSNSFAFGGNNAVLILSRSS